MVVSILIVEDDQSLRFLYKKFLILSGFQVIGQASNGEEAISLFKSFSAKPDLILMDHRMPIKNGIEASKELLALNGSVKIIFASADKTVKEEALSLGVLKFLEKPFSFEFLIKVIKECLNLKKPTTIA